MSKALYPELEVFSTLLSSGSSPKSHYFCLILQNIFTPATHT